VDSPYLEYTTDVGPLPHGVYRIGDAYDHPDLGPALADDGLDIVENIEPKRHAEHMAEHMANDDFKRWGRRRGNGDR
jgi:hypothetical protein